MTVIPDSTGSKYMEKTVLKESTVDRANVEDCHWIKTSDDSKKLKLSKRKDAAKITSLKKNLKQVDLSPLGIRDTFHINYRLCKYYKLL